MDRAQRRSWAARRRESDHSALKRGLGLERGQLRTRRLGQGGRSHRPRGLAGRLLSLVAGVEVLGVQPRSPTRRCGGRRAVDLPGGWPAGPGRERPQPGLKAALGEFARHGARLDPPPLPVKDDQARALWLDRKPGRGELVLHGAP